MYNPSGGDNGNEWVELFNAGGSAIDLSNYSLGWGGADYLPAIQLVGTIPSGGYFVIGGPNGGPAAGYDQVENFDPNLDNGWLVSGGVALFNEQSGDVDATTVPVHAVIYGGIFGNAGLWDESGGVGDVDVPFTFPPAPAGTTIEFDGTVWGEQGTPSPGSGNLIPVPETAPSLLMMLGLAGLAAKGSSRNRVGARRRSK